MNDNQTNQTTLTREELIQLEKKLDRIEFILNEKIMKDCNKMSSHIDFIEKVYNYIKTPLFYIADNIKRIQRFNLMSSKHEMPIEYHVHQEQSTDQ